MGMPSVEQEIVFLAARAGLQLRFDRVALRVVRALQHELATTVREGQTVIIAVAAPIRHPSKTTAALIGLVNEGRSGKIDGEAYGNEICLRWVSPVPEHMPRVFGFVHSHGTSANCLFDIAEAVIRRLGA